MDQNATHITMILDRSGSMGVIRDDVIGGVNTFVESQKRVPGKCTFTLVQFDSQDPYEVVHTGSIQYFSGLTPTTFVPRGDTPLLDAIGRGINETGKYLRDLPEDTRPDKIIFVVNTDGHENASKLFKKTTLRDMITLQRDTYKWQFIFLGANMDAIAEAATFNIPRGSTLTYAHDGKGVHDAYIATVTNVTNYRLGVTGQAVFTEEDRKTQERK